MAGSTSTTAAPTTAAPTNISQLSPGSYSAANSSSGGNVPTNISQLAPGSYTGVASNQIGEPASNPTPGGFLGKLALGIAPVLGDIGQQKTGRQIFGDAVATLLNLGTFFLAPEAVPEEIAGEAALEGGADAASKVVGGEIAPAAENVATQAPTRLQQIGGVLGRGAKFGALAAGSTAAQAIGNSESAADVVGKSAESFGLGTGLGLAAEGVGSLLSSGLQKSTGIRDWLMSSGAPLGSQAVDQVDLAQSLINKNLEDQKVFASDPNLDEGIRQNQINATQAALEPVQDASKNLVDRATQAIGTGKQFDATGQAILDSDKAYNDLYRQNRDALYNQIIPANSTATAETKNTEAAIDDAIQELSQAKGTKPEWYGDLIKMRNGLFGDPDSDETGLITKDTSPEAKERILRSGGIEQKTPTLGDLDATLKHNIESDKGIQEVLGKVRGATNSERLVLNVKNAMEQDINDTIEKVDPTAMTIKDKADTMVRLNKTYIETNPFIQIIRDSDLKGKPELMLQKLIDASLSKNTDVALKDVENFYKVLGGLTSPQAMSFKESLMSSILKEAGGAEQTSMYTPEAVSSLTKNIEAIKKTGLLDASQTNILEDLRDRSQQIIDNNISRTNYINGLRNPESSKIIPSVEEAQETATQLQKAQQLSDISDRMNSNPKSVVKDFVNGKYNQDEMKTITENLTPEQRKTLIAGVNVNTFGKIADNVARFDKNPLTSITEKALPDMMKSFEKFKAENPDLVKEFFDSKTLGDMQKISDSIDQGKVNQAVKNARMMGTFRTGAAVFEAMQGRPMAIYMASRAAMDFERAGMLGEEAAPTTLTGFIEKSKEDDTLAKSSSAMKKRIQSVVTPALKGVVAGAISRGTKNP